MIWLAKNWRYAAGAALLAALVAAFIWYRHSVYQAGAASVQALWDANELTEEIEAGVQAKDNAAKEAAAASHNEEVTRDLQAKNTVSAAAADRYRRLYLQAAGSARTSPPAESGGSSGIAPASQAAGDERADFLARIAAASAAALVEARQNADALDGLIAVVKPQM